LRARGRRDEAAVAAHDPPPGQVATFPGEERTDGPGSPGVAGVVGDVAVAHDLAFAERHDHADDAALEGV
jgi:hypothetical protein